LAQHVFSGITNQMVKLFVCPKEGSAKKSKQENFIFVGMRCWLYVGSTGEGIGRRVEGGGWAPRIEIFLLEWYVGLCGINW
jgi:hypothetical protein